MIKTAKETPPTAECTRLVHKARHSRFFGTDKIEIPPSGTILISEEQLLETYKGMDRGCLDLPRLRVGDAWQAQPRPELPGTDLW